VYDRSLTSGVLQVVAGLLSGLSGLLGTLGFALLSGE
jgi:hypothetical protein